MPRPDVEGQEGCLSTFNTSFLLQNVPYSGQWSATRAFYTPGEPDDRGRFQCMDPGCKCATISNAGPSKWVKWSASYYSPFQKAQNEGPSGEEPFWAAQGAFLGCTGAFLGCAEAQFGRLYLGISYFLPQYDQQESHSNA
jgi:hypothetical protein